ncbi:MAG: hypothetical protein ACRD0J_15065 [Acidimicrobiales bacterium]
MGLSGLGALALAKMAEPDLAGAANVVGALIKLGPDPLVDAMVGWAQLVAGEFVVEMDQGVNHPALKGGACSGRSVRSEPRPKGPVVHEDLSKGEMTHDR